MRRVLFLIFLFCAISGGVSAQVAPARNYPAPVEGDYVIANFHFHSGEVLPELKIHYRTIGTPVRDASGVVRNAVWGANRGRRGGTQFFWAVCGRAVWSGTTARRHKIFHHPPGWNRSR